MKRNLSRRSRASAVCAALMLSACIGAQAGNPPVDADDRGSGWRPTTDGGWSGTGANFGRGWRRDASGNLHGTGENFGRGWRRKSDGGWSGTGENFGQGWEPRGR